MYETSEIRKGLKIELDSDVYIVVDFQHVNPGNWRAFIRTKLKSLSRGTVIERTFRSGEKLGRPDLVRRNCNSFTATVTSIASWIMKTMNRHFSQESTWGPAGIL